MLDLLRSEETSHCQYLNQQGMGFRRGLELGVRFHDSLAHLDCHLIEPVVRSDRFQRLGSDCSLEGQVRLQAQE